MFYTPKYCCNCGEKIERANRSVTDSGRFCDVCKHDFVLQRALVPVFIGLMAVIGIFGIGSYWRSGEKPLNLSTRQFTANPSNRVTPGKNPANQTSQVSADSNVQQTAPVNKGPSIAQNEPETSGLTNRPPVKEFEPAPVSIAEPTYYCGARTKKGTPCTRKVKGGGRCWQHKGQNAMLPPEKLLVSG